MLKAEWLEASLKNLKPLEDFEMMVELCMLAATHLFNAALHAAMGLADLASITRDHIRLPNELPVSGQG